MGDTKSRKVVLHQALALIEKWAPDRAVIIMLIPDDVTPTDTHVDIGSNVPRRAAISIFRELADRWEGQEQVEEQARHRRLS